jgi:subfamily B ATP-binding cassette protein HlyB/CyaB
VFRIRGFLTGQLFGTILDSTTLFFFLPVMFFFSPIMTLMVLAFAGVIVTWLILMLPAYRKKSSATLAAEGAQGAFLIQSLNGIRTIKSLALDARQRHMWDVLVARVAKARLAEGMTGTAIQTVVRPLERLAVSAPYALGVYIAVSSGDPVYVGALFAFLMLSQRVAGPLMQMAQLINQYDEARTAVTIVGRLVNQPAEEGRSGHGVRAPLKGLVEFSGVTFKYKGAVSPALNNISFEIPLGTTLGVMGQERFRKDHDHAAAAAPALRLWRPDQGRRHRCPRVRCRPSPAQCRRRAAREFPVQRHHPRKHRGRKARRDLRRHRQGGTIGRCRGVHRQAATRLRDLCL